MIDLARTRTDPDERANFFEHEARCREDCVTIGTDWAEMRIAEDAWVRFAAAAKRVTSRFAFMEGHTQTSVPSTGAPTLYSYRVTDFSRASHSARSRFVAA